MDGGYFVGATLVISYCDVRRAWRKLVVHIRKVLVVGRLD